MSWLTKFANKGHVRELGLVCDKDGKMAASPEGALENLRDAHFEGMAYIGDNHIEQMIESAHSALGAR